MSAHPEFLFENLQVTRQKRHSFHYPNDRNRNDESVVWRIPYGVPRRRIQTPCANWRRFRTKFTDSGESLPSAQRWGRAARAWAPRRRLRHPTPPTGSSTRSGFSTPPGITIRSNVLPNLEPVLRNLDLRKINVPQKLSSKLRNTRLSWRDLKWKGKRRF